MPSPKARESGGSSNRREAAGPAFLDALPDLIFLIARDGTYLDFHPASELRPYVEPPDFLGRRVLEVLPDDVGKKCMHAVGLALRTKKPQRVEYQLPSPDGIRAFEARIVPRGSSCVVAVVRDITEQRFDLRPGDDDSHYRSIFAASPEAISVSTGGIHVFVNDAYLKLFGYPTPADVLGHPVLNLVAVPSRPAVETILRDHAAGKIGARTIRVHGLHTDGKEIQVELSSSAYSRNERVYTIAVVRQVEAAVTALAANAGGTGAAGALEGPAAESHGPAIRLSPRETEIVRLIADGNSTKQMAHILGIRYKTADTHRTNVMRKLGVHEAPSLVRVAFRLGLLDQ